MKSNLAKGETLYLSIFVSVGYCIRFSLACDLRLVASFEIDRFVRKKKGEKIGNQRKPTVGGCIYASLYLYLAYLYL